MNYYVGLFFLPFHRLFGFTRIGIALGDGAVRVPFPAVAVAERCQPLDLPFVQSAGETFVSQRKQELVVTALPVAQDALGRDDAPVEPIRVYLYMP
ncbi:MAG: hypothetical protein LBF17_01200 [Mediterranea sp.]|nr:hypothetical protein [Mediterranea sp.]